MNWHPDAGPAKPTSLPQPSVSVTHPFAPHMQSAHFCESPKTPTMSLSHWGSIPQPGLQPWPGAMHFGQGDDGPQHCSPGAQIIVPHVTPAVWHDHVPPMQLQVTVPFGPP